MYCVCVGEEARSILLGLVLHKRTNTCMPWFPEDQHPDWWQAQLCLKSWYYGQVSGRPRLVVVSLSRSALAGCRAHRGFKWLNPAKNNSPEVISRILKIRFQQICIISVSGDCMFCICKTCQIVASISVTSQFHKFSYVNFWWVFVIWNLCVVLLPLTLLLCWMSRSLARLLRWRRRESLSASATTQLRAKQQI